MAEQSLKEKTVKGVGWSATANSELAQFLVRVHCLTYNHAPYIVDALNGFTLQRTMFPFVCTILDDASTDGEPKVIKAYLRENFELEDKSISFNEETFDLLNLSQYCLFMVYHRLQGLFMK